MSPVGVHESVHSILLGKNLAGLKSKLHHKVIIIVSSFDSSSAMSAYIAWLDGSGRLLSGCSHIWPPSLLGDMNKSWFELIA